MSAHATVMLVATTLLWGISFPLMKDWQNLSTSCPEVSWLTANNLGRDTLASATLIMLRMFFALFLLGAIRPGLFKVSSWREHRAGLLIGFVFFTAFILQVVGIAGTTPAMSAFLTSLACVWVPLLGWLYWRTSVAPLTLLGLSLGLAGTLVLVCGDSDSGSSQQWGIGLTLLSSVLFAAQILLLDRLGRSIQPANLTASFFFVTGASALLLACFLAATGPGLGPWIEWTLAQLQVAAILRIVLLLTVLSTVLAFHWMNTYQPLVPASRAVLIYLLEPVFALSFSIPWGHDRFSFHLLVGGAIILGGNLLVEVPGWRRGDG